jgi:hypothetical protein
MWATLFSYERASLARTKYKEPVLIELMKNIQCTSNIESR